MKRMALLLIIVFLLSGCSQEDAGGFSAGSSDFQGFVLEKRETGFILSVYGDDPEADYPAYEIIVNEDTIFEGIRANFMEVQEKDDIEVWAVDTETDQIIAERVMTGESRLED